MAESGKSVAEVGIEEPVLGRQYAESGCWLGIEGKRRELEELAGNRPGKLFGRRELALGKSPEGFDIKELAPDRKLAKCKLAGSGSKLIPEIRVSTPATTALVVGVATAVRGVAMSVTGVVSAAEEAESGRGCVLL